jgi:hypothetical protein
MRRMPEAERLEQTLRGLLAQTNPDGRPRYSREEVRDVLALLMLSRPDGAGALSPESARLLGEFSVVIGAPLAQAGNLQAKVDAYFERNPPNRELLRALIG